MFLLKILVVFGIIALKELICADGAWAWGPAVHTVISCNMIGSCTQILPAIASIIQSFPHEYIYGGISADFFIGKGQKKKVGHSHNWETGFKFLSEVNNDKEAAYAYGFLSHLAADVVAHNYFVPDLIHRVSIWKRMGHFYSEAVADKFVDPVYLKIARDVLAMDHIVCDRLLKSAAVRNGYGLRAKKHLYAQSVRISDYLYCLPVFSDLEINSSYNVEDEYMAFMIELSFRLVKDLLSYPDSSACLSHDPIGSDNLRLARRNGFFARLFNNEQLSFQFPIAQELLEL
jgi:Zinc dependent phospholipase C